MIILIDNRHESRPRVMAIYDMKDEGINAFFQEMTGDFSRPAPEEYKRVYSLLKENRYVSGGDYCIQEL